MTRHAPAALALSLTAACGGGGLHGGGFSHAIAPTFFQLSAGQVEITRLGAPLER